MKIAITGTRGIPNILGGVETHCEELFPLIAEKNYDITIIRRKGYVKDHLHQYKGIKLYDLTAPKKKAFEAITHTFKAISLAKFKLKADVIHIHAVGPALAIPYAKLLGLKVVFTHHGPDYDRDKWGRTAKKALLLGEKLGIKYSDEVIVISNVINDIIKIKYQKTNAHLIHNGVPQPVFHTDAEYLKSLNIQAGKYIFAMGRFVPEKNFHQLIHAFDSIEDKKGYQLVIAGDTDFEDEYSQGLKKLAKEKGVILTGFIKGNKLHTLLTNTKAFILPSSHEGLPISLLEAMSYNLPVLVSDIPANKEVGLAESAYFQTNNQDELKEKLNLLINSEAEKISYPMDNYKWEKIAEQTTKVYEKIIH